MPTKATQLPVRRLPGVTNHNHRLARGAIVSLDHKRIIVLRGRFREAKERACR
jgi:hypothetical protein